MTSISLNAEVPRRLRWVAVALGAWSIVAGLFLLQRLLALAMKGIDPRWDRIALELIVAWGGWAALTPLVFYVVRRLPLPSGNAWRVLLHLPIGIAVGVAHSLLVAIVTPLFIWRPSLAPMRDMFKGRLANTVAFETLIYFMVAGVLYACIYAVQMRQRRQQGESALPDSLTIPERDGLLRVPVASIDWLQAEDNYVRLYAGGRSHLVRATLSSLEQKLAASDFVRIHRSAMVPISRIAKLKRLGSDRHVVVLADGTQLRVSRAYKKRVVDAMEPPLAP